MHRTHIGTHVETHGRASLQQQPSSPLPQQLPFIRKPKSISSFIGGFILLLPSTLLVQRKRCAAFGGTKYSILRLLKIVTAFTIGHSITLLLGALNTIAPPAGLIEILIAVSILISAIHALYPLFPGKEYYVSGGFGLNTGWRFHRYYPA